jgi:hypothetical protein
MRRVVVALVLGLSVLGCGMLTPSSEPFPFSSEPFPLSSGRFPFDISGDLYYGEGGGCEASRFLVGVIVGDPELGLAIRDDQNVVHPVIWHGGYKYRWSSTSPGEVELLHGSTVMATTGRRYKIGGSDHTDRFWACANVFIPQ